MSEVMNLTAEQRAERIACCKYIIKASWAYDLLKDVARTALAALEADTKRLNEEALNREQP